MWGVGLWQVRGGRVGEEEGIHVVHLMQQHAQLGTQPT